MKSWFYSWIRVQAAVFYRLNPELAYFTFKIDLRDYEEKSVNMIFYDKNGR